jgi:hypothetical protein
MFGNGHAVITITARMTFNRMTLVCCAAVPSTFYQTSRAARSAAGSAQLTGSGTSVFELLSPRFFHHDSDLWRSELWGSGVFETLVIAKRDGLKKEKPPAAGGTRVKNNSLTFKFVNKCLRWMRESTLPNCSFCI